MEPELAEDGCNWHTYGSWVLKALSEDDLMGYLEGSETRPTHPSLLQGDGDGWTPQTNEEREAVTVWKTADDVWHQRAAMAHQYIIFGLPDSILMLCMHLDTPHETFVYLENRYGPIPRPESLKVVDKAVPRCDTQPEQDAAGSQSEVVDSPSNCAEITAGHLEPETEIIDAQQVDYLPLVEVGAADSEMLDECTNALDAPESSSKTLDSVGNAIQQAGVRQQMPDPPTTHYELPTSRIECPVLGLTPNEPDKVEGGDWHDDGAGGGCPDSHRVRKSMLTAPPTPLPKHTGHVIRPYRVPRRRGRLKSSTESVSGTRTRQNAYHTRAGPMRLLLPLSTSKKRITFTAGGPQQGAGVESKMTKLGIRAINTKTSEMRGNLPLSEMRPKEPGKTKETGGGGDGTVSNEFANSHRIKKSMLADIRSQQGKLETKRPNGSPAPSKPTRNDFSHPPGTIRDPRRRGRIKTDLRNVRNAEARGRNASILTIPILPPRELARTLWNVANTYWRHGIPPEHTRSVDKPLLFETAASQQRHKAEDERTANGFPKWKLQQRGASNTTKHRPYSHGLEALLAEACTLVYWIYY